MVQNIKNILLNIVSTFKLVYKIAIGCDYRALNHYILQINQHKGVNEILFAAAQCFRDLLDYEIFGFVMNGDEGMNVWVDPCIHKIFLMDAIKKDFQGQEIDFILHHFEKKPETSQNTDIVSSMDLISYPVLRGPCAARLYILPRRRVLFYHQNIITIIVRSLGIALENVLRMRHLENVAAIDPLTDCYNRRSLNKFIENDIAYAHRYGHDLSVVMIDIDNFKTINDSYGHAAGDKALREVSRLIATMVRKSDLLARYGGEEFVLVLPETGLFCGTQLAEKIRKSLARHAIDVGDRSITLTASFGVAGLRGGMDSTALLHEADEMLYVAKAQGKNIVAPKLPTQSHAQRASDKPAFQYF